MARSTRLLRAWTLAALAAAALAGDTTIDNPSFEAPGEEPEGWAVSVGATSGGAGESVIAVDSSVARDGKASLRLSGDANTGTWRIVEQTVPIVTGDRVTLRVAARSRGIVREGRQYANANAVVSFLSAANDRKALLGSPQITGDHDWCDLVIDVIAPPGADKARVGLFLSMTGTLWFDDVRLEVAHATAEDAAGRARAFDALAGHLRRTYPFFGFAGKPPADELFKRHRDLAVQAKDEAAFVAEIRAMLGELDDTHVTVESLTGTLATAKPSTAPRNFSPLAMLAALNERLDFGPNVLAGRIGVGADAIGYVGVASFQMDDAGLARVERALDTLADTKALILDVRPNGGGNESAAARIAGRFTDKDVLYARAVRRDPLSSATDAFGPPIDRVLKPTTPGKADTRRVVVLQGPYCVSSTEGFLLMMRALPNVTTIGQRSGGASGHPAPFDLLPTVKIWTSRWRSLLPDGTCIEGKGLAPAIVVEGSHAKSDPTLERALAELRR